MPDTPQVLLLNGRLFRRAASKVCINFATLVAPADYLQADALKSNYSPLKVHVGLEPASVDESVDWKLVDMIVSSISTNIVARRASDFSSSTKTFHIFKNCSTQ